MKDRSSYRILYRYILVQFAQNFAVAFAFFFCIFFINSILLLVQRILLRNIDMMTMLSIIEEPEVGKIYHGTVKRIVDFGAFIEILPGKEGLCHISKLSKTRVKNVSDVLSVGQQVDVKLIEIDRMGRLNLSYIDAQPEEKA